MCRSGTRPPDALVDKGFESDRTHEPDLRFEGAEQIRQLVIFRAISCLRIE
ncbi:MAG: hypothetical protein M3445_02165 [Actinomycetota bacterium]|nr:hypothetical protein [Actinomycetota bacterium]